MAAGPDQRVEVTGNYLNSLGSNDAASAGTITPQLIESRPLLRPGTLLELIPAWRSRSTAARQQALIACQAASPGR